MQTHSGSRFQETVSKRSTRLLTAVALLAVVPAALYALGRSTLAVVAVVNVLLIFGSLYLLTSPTEGEGHGTTDDLRTTESDESATATTESPGKPEESTTESDESAVESDESAA